ncbi:triglyceride lipase-cholesterol esterase [Scheffersomyces xylosifermentans]|uniref:triglyceride lipase-cholesterol esterase n=1 Tax=Scheffersomyces xylosifermentans TaxID=1304137 RepID=UPI00315C74A5
MYVPLLGRLGWLDWPVIATSFALAWVEFIVSVITALLPSSVLDFFAVATTTMYSLFTTNPVALSSTGDNVSNDSTAEESYHPKYTYLVRDLDISKEKYDLMIGLLNSTSIDQMCNLFGYDVEGRIVQTKDDYLLTVHRIVGRDDSARVPNGKVVYLHHGLLMSSDVWVTMLDKYSNLPFILYDLGYDVWLGNNRGNKYSQKHLHYKTHTERFWDFSMDEFAIFDIPNTIEYILNATNKSKLTYVGFSQGSAQAFASVSVNSELNDKIEKLIAISPATTPHGLYSKFLDFFLKASPNIFFLLFSRKILMPSIFFWQRIMYPPLYDNMIDISNYILFNWKSANISKIQKLSSYAHLYSSTSVKTVVHWFQIMSSKNFQMYHDSYSKLSGLTPISYPLKNIRVPIHLIYGDIDSLVDIDVMKSQLPHKTTTAHAVHNHEHLDNLWGEDVYEQVFKQVLHALGEDENDVYTQLFRTYPSNTKLIEDIIEEEIEYVDEEKTLNNLHSYLKGSNIDDIAEVEEPAEATTSKYLPSHKQSSAGSVFV